MSTAEHGGTREDRVPTAFLLQNPRASPHHGHFLQLFKQTQKPQALSGSPCSQRRASFGFPDRKLSAWGRWQHLCPSGSHPGCSQCRTGGQAGWCEPPWSCRWVGGEPCTENPVGERVDAGASGAPSGLPALPGHKAPSLPQRQAEVVIEAIQVELLQVLPQLHRLTEVKASALHGSHLP